MCVAAARTEAVLRAIVDEMRGLPECPCLILGDFNAEPSDLPTFQKLTSLGWTDMGASAEIWNRAPNTPTCRAPNANGPGSVRDYILASPSALPLISDFAVTNDSSFATHSVLSCKFDFSRVSNVFPKLQLRTRQI